MVLVQGSPYVLPQPGVAYPLTPQLLAMSPGHDFLYVVYEQVPFHFDLPKDVYSERVQLGTGLQGSPQRG